MGRVKEKKSFRENKTSFGETRRRLLIEGVKRIAKEKTPIHIEKLLSYLEYELGIRRENAKSIVIILHDIEKITIDSMTDMVYWGKKTQITRQKHENNGEK